MSDTFEWFFVRRMPRGATAHDQWAVYKVIVDAETIDSAVVLVEGGFNESESAERALRFHETTVEGFEDY